MRKKLVVSCCILTVLIWEGAAAAQQAQDPRDAQKPTESYSGPSWSFADRVMGNLRNRFSLSLGAFEGYTNNIFRTSIGKEDVWGTTFTARVATNAGSRRNIFHADYGCAYPMYNGHSDLNMLSHLANLQYTYQASRRITLSATDAFTSGTNDFGLFGGYYSMPLSQVPDSSNEVLYARQRITQNSLAGSAGFALSRKSNLTVFASHQYYQYDLYELQDNQAVTAGASFRYQFTSWLSISSSYQNYLNNVDERFRDTQIHRLEVGAISFRLSRYWRASMSGGIEATKYSKEWQYGASAGASLIRTSERNIFSVNYLHGLTASIGLPGLYKSDRFHANFGQMLTAWMNFRATGYYSRNDSFLEQGRYELIEASTGLEFAVRRNLIASVNYSYWDQLNRGLSVPITDFARWAANAGITYVWPGARR